jgi:hypothetical protein
VEIEEDPPKWRFGLEEEDPTEQQALGDKVAPLQQLIKETEGAF